MHSNTKTPDDATYFIGSSSAIVQPEHQPPRDYGACAPHGQVMGRNLNEVHLQPNSFMATAIFTTLCCNFVFGLIAVIFASRVDILYLNGDYVRARKSSQCAAGWSFAGILTGIVFMVGAALSLFFGVGLYLSTKH
ncbi:proline-rich transmembrane protein 1-like [Apostichopus japonicus]|uniref:proline-rich transmembrane protein 1-like n=1 Tax=Stichopus japonicus TaxID=307972 RepID=UPI003AB478C1